MESLVESSERSADDLVTGMLIAVFGDARDARLLGIMRAITLTSVLFADIDFLPALLRRAG